MELLPESGDMEEERDIRKANMVKRSKLAEEEIGKLKKCDRPLTKNEWVAMSIGAQWATLRVVGVLKEAKPGGGFDRIEDGNDQCGAGRDCKPKTTASTASAVGVPNAFREIQLESR